MTEEKAGLSFRIPVERYDTISRPKYNFNKCETNIYFFILQRFGPSPSPNFKINRFFSPIRLKYNNKI